MMEKKMETIMMGYPKHVRVPVRLVPGACATWGGGFWIWHKVHRPSAVQNLRMQSLSSTCLGTLKVALGGPEQLDPFAFWCRGLFSVAA